MSRLASENLLKGRCLDFGCGRGFDVDYFGIVGYDPYYRNDYPTGLFDTITCIYVLNVLPTEVERLSVLKEILGLLAYDGIAYVAVRRDVKNPGFTTRGTYQENLQLSLPVLHKTRGFYTYILTKEIQI